MILVKLIRIYTGIPASPGEKTTAFFVAIA
jgi:hypothetical protein